MFRFLLTVAITSVLVGCAPPRWAESLCRGQPDVWDLNERDLATQLRRMNDDQLLDLAACNMATSHPSTHGFPDHFVTDRSPAMATLLLTRIEARDEGLISMGYMALLSQMAQDNPRALSAQQRESAVVHCKQLYSQDSGLCKSF